jgi:hypothetical protein
VGCADSPCSERRRDARRQMLWIVRHGVRYSGMGAWSEEMLSDGEAWEVVSFLSRLNALPAAVETAWHGHHQS